LPKEDIGSCRPMRRVWVEEFWIYSAHAQWYARDAWAKHILRRNSCETIWQMLSF
jgi:hypothetical protein